MSHIHNHYCPGIPSQNPDVCLMAVLTDSNHTDPDRPEWAVYVGLVKLPANTDDPDYQEAREKAARLVASCGAKQSHSKALAYFPTLEKERYRA